MEHPDPFIISTFFNVSKNGRFTTPELNLHNGGKIRTWFPLSIYETHTVDWKKIPNYQEKIFKPTLMFLHLLSLILCVLIFLIILKNF